ncbi:Uncharacterized conserved protein, DUF2164 family [Salinibacillus kushneri]|uniref:Uncharacterized conserved protein, DUF2164 family n=2 Tax=Salinibacillus kushneri TaxID=237682 RepID=A0A1I0DMJ7_9BACI|nr:Uncharacterized conserved protein, DUF2164 family [Salinibacillus kushneri]
MEERGEEMGELAAENIYQFMKEDIAPYFYNEGIHDARLMAEQKMDSLDEDIRSLEKQVHRSSSR